MLLITKRRKIGAICGHTIYAISKSEMIPIPNSSMRSNMTNSKNENRSFVHSACKCNMYLVLLRGPMRLVIKIAHYSFVIIRILSWLLFYFLSLIFGTNSLSWESSIRSRQVQPCGGNICTIFVNTPFGVNIRCGLLLLKLILSYSGGIALFFFLSFLF